MEVQDENLQGNPNGWWRNKVSLDGKAHVELGDGGIGARTVRDFDLPTTSGRRAKNAIDLIRRQRPHLLQTLKLVLKNGNNRKESIWQIMHGVTRGENTTATSANSSTTSRRSANERK